MSRQEEGSIGVPGPMTEVGMAQILGDTRRAAAVVVHRQRGDLDGVSTILSEALVADRVPQLIMGRVDLLRDPLAELTDVAARYGELATR